MRSSRLRIHSTILSSLAAGFVVTAVLVVFATASFVRQAEAYASPGSPRGFVSDFAGVLSGSDVSSLDSRLKAFKDSTGAEVAVVTVPSLGGETIETYAVDLFQEWGIGTKGKDNGLLIVVAPNDRQARIEVGYGLEGTVTDLQAGKIVRDLMIPAFKRNDYPAGISAAVDAVTGLISGDPTALSRTSSGSASSFVSKNFFALLFFGLMIVNVFARALGKTKSWWLGGVIGGIIGAVVGLIFGFIYVGLTAIVVLTILGLIFDFIVSRFGGGKGPGGFWFLGGPGTGGGSGFGGFGGFGGGRSGGGGASGSW